jgi:hypothetical protein
MIIFDLLLNVGIVEHVGMISGLIKKEKVLVTDCQLIEP